MACAVELRDSITEVDSCPAPEETVPFVGPTSYVRRRWDRLIQCIVEAVLSAIAPDDEDIIIDSNWAGRNYIELPHLAGKRYRVFREGILMKKAQWRKLTGGGIELLTPNDQWYQGETLTIVQY